MALVDTIKQIVQDVLNSKTFSDVGIATIVSSNLDFKLENQKQSYPRELLLIPKQIRIDDTLKTGDKIYLIRKQGGQQFLVVGKV